VAYPTVHQWAISRLKVKLKVPRRREQKTGNRGSRRIKKTIISNEKHWLVRLRAFISRGKEGDIGVKIRVGWDGIQYKE